MHAYANFQMKMVIRWRAFWGSKGGQLVYSFIVDNTKYMGNNSGGPVGVAAGGQLRHNGLLAYYNVCGGFTKKEMCALSTRVEECILVKLQHVLCL
jgi:hypothetical protein